MKYKSYIHKYSTSSNNQQGMCTNKIDNALKEDCSNAHDSITLPKVAWALLMRRQLTITTVVSF